MGDDRRCEEVRDSLVEVSLGILTHQAIRRGTFASAHNLIEAIGALTDGRSVS